MSSLFYYLRFSLFLIQPESLIYEIYIKIINKLARFPLECIDQEDNFTEGYKSPISDNMLKLFYKLLSTILYLYVKFLSSTRSILWKL